MKSLLVFVFSFSSIISFADECKKNICVNQTVIDSNNNIGMVTGFPDSETARYKSGYYTYDTNLKELSPEISTLHNISKGKTVVDDNSNVGTALFVFADGRISYKSGYYSYISTKVVAETTEYNYIKTGTIVVDDNSNVGTAINTFEDGRIYYKSGYYSYVSTKVVGEINEYNSIKKNTIVIDDSNNVGTALYVFRDGRVNYKSGYYTYVSKNVQPEIANLGLITKNSIVIDDSNNIGTTLYVFADKRVNYKSGYYTYVSKSISPKVDTTNGIKSNDIVIDDSNNIGTVIYTFEDGRVNYKSGYYTYVSKKVSPTVASFDRYKPGQLVIDDSDNVGTIIYTFRDGRISYKSGYYSYIGTKLFIETDSNPNYNKETYYGASHFTVGKPIHFFENGKIQIAKLNDLGTSVESKLYNQIDSIGDYKASIKAMNSLMEDCEIKMAFENGAVTYTILQPKDSSKKDKLFAGKVYNVFLGYDVNKDAKVIEQLKSKELINILRDVVYYVANQNKLSTMSMPSNFQTVFTNSDLPEIKKSLLDYLFENPEQIEDKELRKAVRNYLQQ